MRNVLPIFALVTIATAAVAPGCGDDPAADNPAGPTGTGGSDPTTTSGDPGSGASGGAGGGAANGGTGGGGGTPFVEPDPSTCADVPAMIADATLGEGKCYILNGIVKVTGTLTITPGTWIFGDTATKGTLVILPGGKLIADGTADLPIVFTSEKAKGSRAPGDWGGVIILGRDVCNDAAPAALCQIEGLTDGTTFGNTAGDAVANDSSGTLRHVRIHYPGIDLDGMGNEINGLTMGGVGSGTTISHVMVSNTLDDCFEWFGGSVNADHLIANNCGDDMFDTDSGFSGRVQFVFGRQINTITSDPNGFEMDTDSTDFDKAPASSPKFANITLCGNKAAAPASPNVGMVLRRGTDGAHINAIVTDFSTAGLSVRNVPNTGITLTSSLVFDNPAVYDTKHEASMTWLEDQTGNGTAAPAGFGDCQATPPAPFPMAAITGGAPTGHADATAAYIGAFEDAADNWMTGNWVDWATE